MRISDWSSDVCSSDLVMAVFTTLIEISADAGQHRQGTVCHADHLGKSDKIRRPCQLVTAHVAACAANQPRTTKIRHDRFKALARNILFFGNRADLTGAMGLASDIEKRLEIGRASWRERVCQYV